MAEDGYAGTDGRYGGHTAGVIKIHTESTWEKPSAHSPCSPVIDETSWPRSNHWKLIIAGFKPVNIRYRPTETSRGSTHRVSATYEPIWNLHIKSSVSFRIPFSELNPLPIRLGIPSVHLSKS